MCLGIPGKIIRITDRLRQLAMVDIGGIQREVNLSCIADAEIPLEKYLNIWVLVHVGFAMSRINEEEAMATLKALRELGEMQEELASIQHSAA